METFLARVVKVYPTNTPFYERVKGNISVYNDNTNFTEEDGRLYGAITYAYQNAIVEEDIAFPFDKNNFTFPIKGETITILKIEGETFYLPYSSTPYSNYREKASLKVSSQQIDSSLSPGGDSKGLTNTKNTGGEYSATTTKNKETNGGYSVNEKVKFLNPKNGDTIISGRVGNTIRFSELFLTEDDKSSSPGIFIRNKQNPELDSKPIGTLVDEDINKDGTSIYITSNKTKIPFKETTKKQKVAFKDFPSSDKLTGNQLFVNSDRIVLSAKASEFIIFGKGNTGIITDGRFTIDSINDSHIQSNNNVILQSNRNIVLETEGTGNIWLGNMKKTNSEAGDDVQKMVLGGELIKILEDLIDEITGQVYGTSCGPTDVGPINSPAFNSIKGRLKTILSARNYLTK
jgi:hypothetical protein